MSRFRVRTFTLKRPPRCPVCGQVLELATNISPEQGHPGAGASALCVYCRVPLVFTGRSTLRRMTNTEWLALDPEIRQRLTRARAVIHSNPPPPDDEPS